MKKTILVIVLVLLVAGGAYWAKYKRLAPGSDTTGEVSGIVAEVKQVCYYKETAGEESTDYAFTSVNYEADGTVHGVINWIPGEKDSLVGSYAGVVEDSDVPGYATRLNIVYSGWGEGILSKQQEIILVGDGEIKTGVGEMVQGDDGVWRIKDEKGLTYGNALPEVSCDSVPVRIKTDYSTQSS